MLFIFGCPAWYSSQIETFRAVVKPPSKILDWEGKLISENCLLFQNDLLRQIGLLKKSTPGVQVITRKKCRAVHRAELGCFRRKFSACSPCMIQKTSAELERREEVNFQLYRPSNRHVKPSIKNVNFIMKAKSILAIVRCYKFVHKYPGCQQAVHPGWFCNSALLKRSTRAVSPEPQSFWS